MKLIQGISLGAIVFFCALARAETLSNFRVNAGSQVDTGDQVILSDLKITYDSSLGNTQSVPLRFTFGDGAADYILTIICGQFGGRTVYQSTPVSSNDKGSTLRLRYKSGQMAFDWSFDESYTVYEVICWK